ncbi:hypothetical protein D3C81_1865030 [compost metagenome]
MYDVAATVRMRPLVRAKASAMLADEASITSTSPDSSADARAGSLGMNWNTTRSHGCAPPQ